MISFSGVTYSYPGAVRPVLDAVDLVIPKGAFALVVGASGSGKSTLLRCLNGLVPHFSGGAMSGSILVAGEDPVRQGPRGMSSLVGMVFQDPESQAVMETVEAELAYALENQGLPPHLIGERLRVVLERLGIGHLRGRRLSTLSGGERQRVALGSVLALEPRVLVLDEPTSQLDPEGATQVLDLVARLHDDLGLTIVLSEHRLERVIEYADRIVYLPGDGSLRAGPSREMLREIDQAPPLISLGRTLGWDPLPLSVEQARDMLAPARTGVPAGSVAAQASQDKAPSETEIDAERLYYAYGDRHALQDVTFTVRPGEIVALMGSNGSGKTTLLKLLVGLLAPDRGTLRLRGREAREISLEQRIRSIGYVPQNPNALLFADTAREELAFTRRNHRLSPEIPEDLTQALGIERVLDLYPRDLSVGERQRVALGAILAGEPQVVLLDEPTRGVDRAQKQAILDYLAGERLHGRTVLLATHDVELVAESADRIVLLDQGHIIDDGPVREVMRRHPAYCSQIGRLYPDARYLTPAQALEAAR